MSRQIEVVWAVPRWLNCGWSFFWLRILDGFIEWMAEVSGAKLLRLFVSCFAFEVVVLLRKTPLNFSYPLRRANVLTITVSKDDRDRLNRWSHDLGSLFTRCRSWSIVGGRFHLQVYISWTESPERRSSIVLYVIRDPATSALHDRPSCFQVTKFRNYGWAWSQK